ncbi:MAG: DEAD/DEAH box helicase [Spirosomaceae bacterium]|jgi:ATP-dependent RNA helicase DeaD|nr:DEAD/DEAH box helicase [Spirosomataceae bacterium]
MQKLKFSELPVSEEILQAVAEMGFVEASPIQSEAIPVVLQGRDVIGQAQTGTGKTAAFGIPAVEFVNPDIKSPQVLILCPTRELAVQVGEQLKKIAQFKRGVFIEVIFGGDSYDRQIRSLKKGVQIVVGTPGRVIDHLERKTLNLSELRMMILDEADEMLNMGFREDIEKVLSMAPEERQTLLFSATMSKEILSITKRFQKDPAIVKVVKEEIANVNIEQFYFAVRREAKMEVMCRLIEVHDLKLILVFSNMKSKVDEIVSELQLRGYAAEGLHGDMRQQARTQVMNKFRGGSTTILVATDVAARGIDVKGVDAVFNFDIPMDLEYYVHRIGRTGRAGKTGKAFALASGVEKKRLRDIENYIKVRIPKGEIPTLAELQNARNQKFIEQIKEVINEGVDDTYEPIIETLKEEGYYNTQILSALFKMQMGALKSNFADADLAEEDRRPKTFDRNERGSDRRFDRNDRGGRDSRSGGFDRERRGSFEPRGDRSRSTEPRFGGRDAGRRGSGREGMVRLFINLGRKDNVAPNHIVGAITSEARIPGKAIGQIDIYDKFSFVEVPQNDVNSVLKAMNGNTINGREASIEIAK